VSVAAVLLERFAEVDRGYETPCWINAIGHAGEDPERLRALARYLDERSASSL